MRNSRRIIAGFVMALALSGAVLKADTGAPGGPKRGTCGFLQGILYKMPPDVAVSVAVIWEALWACDFE